MQDLWQEDSCSFKKLFEANLAKHQPYVIFNRSIREFSQGCDAQDYFYAESNKFEK